MGFAQTNNVYNLHNPDVTDRSVLVDYLFDRMNWTTSREIKRDIGMTPLRVRQLAQLYPTLLVSSTEGYKLAIHATRREIIHNVQSLIERANKISARAAELASMI